LGYNNAELSNAESFQSLREERLAGHVSERRFRAPHDLGDDPNQQNQNRQ